MGVYGPCRCNPTQFLGRILAVNGEDTKPKRYTKRTLITGPGGYNFPYGAAIWLNNNYTQYKGQVTKHAIAYTNSNCVAARETMVKDLSRLNIVHAYGRCTGYGAALKVKKKIYKMAR